MIAFIVIGVIVVLLAVWLVAMYNGLVGLRNRAQESWRQVDVELKRRHDLIPNLVETVKGYAGHERGTLDAVISARAKATQASTPAQSAAAEQELTAAMGRLMAVSEAYPQLQANQGFAQLQSELTSTEDRIASSRRYYNATVRDLNTKVDSFPSNLIANAFGVHKEQYFEVEDTARSTPQVNFDTNSARTVDGPTDPAQAGPFGASDEASGPIGGQQLSQPARPTDPGQPGQLQPPQV